MNLNCRVGRTIPVEEWLEASLKAQDDRFFERMAEQARVNKEANQKFDDHNRAMR